MMICLLDVAERGGERVHWIEDSNKERKERLSIRVKKETPNSFILIIHNSTFLSSNKHSIINQDLL